MEITLEKWEIEMIKAIDKNRPIAIELCRRQEKTALNKLSKDIYKNYAQD